MNTGVARSVKNSPLYQQTPQVINKTANFP